MKNAKRLNGAHLQKVTRDAAIVELNSKVVTAYGIDQKGVADIKTVKSILYILGLQDN